MHSHGRAPRPSVRRRTAAIGRRTGRGSARSTPARVAGRLLGVRADAAPPALQSLGLLLEFLCPLPELLSDLRSDGDPQQIAASLGFRSHIVRAKHGGFRLSPPLGNKARGIAAPTNIERLPAGQRRYPRVAARPRSGLAAAAGAPIPPDGMRGSARVCATSGAMKQSSGKMILTARLLRLAAMTMGWRYNRPWLQTPIRTSR